MIYPNWTRGDIMPFSTYMDNKVMDEIFGKTDYVAPATLYVGLSTTAPTKASGNITEPAGNAYARVAVVNNTTNFPNASGGTKNNGTVITFPEATGAWGTVSNWVIFDAITAGNVIAYGTLTNPKAIDVGDTPSFNASTLTLSLT